MADLLPEHPDFLWDNPRLKSSYDVVIVGAGGHGLATAYYLAKEHGITNVAVIDKGWLGGGNMARNTTIIRSNYMLDKSTRFFDRSLQMWEGLDEELDYDFLFSQRGLITLAHTEAEVRESIRRIESNNLNGADAAWLTPQEVKELLPIVNISDDIRHPVMGAAHQPRAAIAKHDHVAWAYARNAAAMGVDIIQDTEVTGFLKNGDQVIGVETSRGNIATEKVGIAVAGHSSLVAEKAGFQVPIQSRTLQALVSELFEPVHPTILTSHHIHVYVSQAHKGELVMGANTDPYTAYGARGGFHTIQRQLAAAVELVPIFARAHLIRVWGGVVDISPDSTPIIGKTPVHGIYINCGWGSGGFKGVPIGGYTLAHTIAHDAPHELNKDFGLDRYFTGHLVDEHSASGVLH